MRRRRSWLATEPVTVAFLTVEVDRAGMATGAFALGLYAGGRPQDGRPQSCHS